jgi:hypothetical protein
MKYAEHQPSLPQSMIYVQMQTPIFPNIFSSYFDAKVSFIFTSFLQNENELAFIFPILQLSFSKITFIHICIQCLGHFSPLPPTTSFPLTPLYQAETILPLSLILLKREYKQ